MGRLVCVHSPPLLGHQKNSPPHQLGWMPRLLQHLMEQGHLDHLEQAVLLPPLPVYAPNCSCSAQLDTTSMQFVRAGVTARHSGDETHLVLHDLQVQAVVRRLRAAK